LNKLILFAGSFFCKLVEDVILIRIYAHILCIYIHPIGVSYVLYLIIMVSYFIFIICLFMK